MSWPPWSPTSSRTAWSVWPTGNYGHTDQLRQRGYIPESNEDTRGIPPAIAAHAINLYTRPGALVVDPDCGAGTVLVEALRAGRHAVGMTATPRWWRVARANVTAAKNAGAWHDGTVLDMCADSAQTAREAGLIRRADLLLTAIRFPQLLSNRSPDLDSISTVRTWTSILRPGGHAIVVLSPHRLPDGTFVDLAAAVSAAAEATGLIVTDRCVALTAKLRSNRITPRATVVERKAADATRAFGTPIALSAHRTILVMRAPDASQAAGTQHIHHPAGHRDWDERAYG